MKRTHKAVALALALMMVPGVANAQVESIGTAWEESKDGSTSLSKKMKDSREKDMNTEQKAATEAFGQAFVTRPFGGGIDSRFLYEGTGDKLGVLVTDLPDNGRSMERSKKFALLDDKGNKIVPTGSKQGKDGKRMFMQWGQHKGTQIQFVKMDEKKGRDKKQIEDFYKRAQVNGGHFEFWRIAEVAHYDRSELDPNLFHRYVDWAEKKGEGTFYYYDHFRQVHQALRDGELDKYLPKRYQEKKNAAVSETEEFEAMEKGAHEVGASIGGSLY